MPLAFWQASPKQCSCSVEALGYCNENKMRCDVVVLADGCCLVRKGALQHPWPWLGFTLLQSGAWSWGQAPFENHRCLCCCMKVLHMLSSQQVIPSCGTCCLSMVQNICAKRFAQFLLAKVILIPPPSTISSWTAAFWLIYTVERGQLWTQ